MSSILPVSGHAALYTLKFNLSVQQRIMSQQIVYMISSDEKFTLLMNLLDQKDVQSMIVFANRRDICRDLFEKLQACGVSCGMLSGEVDQNKRVRTLEQFKSGQTRVLCGNRRGWARHPCRWHQPCSELHTSRNRLMIMCTGIGRTGRAGATGVSISFACEDDGFLLPEIEKTLGKKLVCEMAPVELLKALPTELVQRAK
jgi:ATP-dependent RNA helicase RhlB